MLCLIPHVYIGVFAADDTIILNEAFENSSGEAEAHNIVFSSPLVSGYGVSACFPAKEYTTVGKYFPRAITSGRYLISFDFYTDTKGEETFRLVDETGTHMVAKLRNLLTFRADGNVGIQRIATRPGDAGDGEYDWPSTQDPDLRSSYKVNEWNSFELWIDFDNSEIAYYLNDDLITCIPLDLNIEGIKGFSFCKYETSDGLFYLDNLKMVKENEANSNGFAPVYIKAATEEDIVGNNFYSDSMPSFNMTFRNRLNSPKEYLVTYTAENQEGTTVWTKNSELSLGANGTYEEKVNITAKYYGVMKLIITVDDGENTYTKTVSYTLSNHTSDMPNNKRSGVRIALASGKDTLDEMVSVIKGAGIGNARGEELNWASIEKDGKYSLSDSQNKLLDELYERDIDYLFLINAGHPDYSAATNVNNLPFADSDGYTALSKYCEELMRLANGRVKYVEVLNEVHAKLSRGYTNELVSNIHKAVYKGVKAGDENVMVVGIDEDSYAYNVHDYISGYLKEMGGEKCFDAVSLHPYPRYQDGAPYYFEGDKAAEPFVNGVRGLLENYGYDKNTPIFFSELGWADTNPNENFYKDYERQAAYNIRAQANAWANGLADIVFIFTLSEAMYCYDTAPHEATFGIVESYTKSGAEIPYLGKPVYCALAYYNGLMADAKYVGNENLGITNSYGYKFTDRNNREVMMLGMLPDGAEKKVSLNTDKEYVILADMYGNESLLKADSGSVEITLIDEPQYLIEYTDRPMAVIEGNTAPNGDIVIDIYREGFSAENPEALYYHGQEAADENGNYSINIPIDNSNDKLIAYISCASEGAARVYEIYEKENYVLTAYENASTGLCEITATVRSINDNNVMIVGLYDDRMLISAKAEEAERISEKMLKFKGLYDKKYDETVKCFFFENATNIIPVDEYTVLESER